MTGAFPIGPPGQDDLKKIVVRLLEIASRSEDATMQYELMQLADELVTIIDQIETVERDKR